MNTPVSGSHLALIVEDDAETAEDLQQILNSLRCRSIVADNKEDALAEIQAQALCFVLLDLQIKERRASLKGHFEQGASLLREIRQRHPDHPGTPGGCHRLPILVVSGYARETAAAIEIMKDGASDFVHKPLKSRDVSERIRRVLEGSGRGTHASCGEMARSPRVAAANAPVRITITGRRDRRRTVVNVGTRAVSLQDRLLRVLLHLMVAYADGKLVHKTDLGGTDAGGFKGISELREALRPVLPSVEMTIPNEYGGNYGLVGVELGECDVTALRAIGDRRIADLAEQLALRSGKRPARV